MGVPLVIILILDWDFPVHKNHPAIGGSPILLAANLHD